MKYTLDSGIQKNPLDYAATAGRYAIIGLAIVLVLTLMDGVWRGITSPTPFQPIGISHSPTYQATLAVSQVPTPNVIVQPSGAENTGYGGNTNSGVNVTAPADNSQVNTDTPPADTTTNPPVVTDPEPPITDPVPPIDTPPVDPPAGDQGGDTSTGTGDGDTTTIVNLALPLVSIATNGGGSVNLSLRL